MKSALEFSNDISQPLAIIQIDFNKAFDTISQNFILDIAKQIRIPSSLVNWFKVILTNVTSQILVNGIKTNQFFVKRGIRQGCPLSMFLFILGTEPLTQKINKNSSIKGLTLGKIHLKISQYADDVIFFLSDSNSIIEAHITLKTFSTISGLESNPSKPKIIYNSQNLIATFKSFFPDGKVHTSLKILGITFSFNSSLIQSNWKQLIGIIHRICNAHSHRKLSIYGKTEIINSLILLRILFLSRIIYPKRRHIKQITRIVFDF